MRFIAAMGVFGAAAFLLSHPSMIGLGDPAFVGWDLTRVFWADHAFVQRSIEAGELPLWNPYDRAGYPFFAEPQSGAFDPLSWVLSGAAVLLGYAPAWLVIVKTVILFGIASAGLAGYLRNRGFPAWLTVWACTVLVLCPRMDKLKDQSALWPTVWVGWLLWMIDRCLHHPSWRTGVALGAVAGLIVDSGYPPGAFRLALLAAPYFAIEMTAVVRKQPDRRAYLRRLAVSLAGGTVVLVLLTAGQIWSTLQVLPETMRDAIDAETVMASPIRAEHVVGVVAPFTDKAPLYVYAGMATVIGAMGAWLRPNAHVVLWTVLAALGFVLACGDDLPVLPALVELPGFSAFRIPGHYLVIGVVAFILLAAHGLQTISNLGGRWRAAVIGLAAVELVLFVRVTDQPGGVAIVLLVASAASVVGLAYAGARLRRFLVWELVVVTALDLFVASRPMAEILQPYPSREMRRARVLAKAIDHRTDVRVADYEWARRRMGPRQGVRDLIGHRPALTDPRYMMLYRAGLRSPSILAAANVGVVAYDLRYRVPRSPRLERVEKQRRLFRVADPWPLAYWTNDIAVVPEANDALRWLRRQPDPGAVFEASEIPGGRLPDSAMGRAHAPDFVPADVTRYRHNVVSVDLHAPADGVLVVAEGYDAGWTAQVDGRPAPLWRTNLVFRAVPVPAGSHRVELAYRPPLVVALWVVWLMTVLGLLAVAGGSFYRRFRPPAPRATR